jgi:hypothetical protein
MSFLGKIGASIAKSWGDLKAEMEENRQRWANSPLGMYTMPEAEARAKATEQVVGMLRDPDPKIRCAAVVVLGLTRDPKYIPVLAVARTDRDATVRQGAVQALDRINPDWRRLPEAGVAAEYELNIIAAELASVFRAPAGAPAAAAAPTAKAAPPAEDRTPSLADVYAAQILQFLTKESTRAYEQQNNAWWSENDLRLILVRAGLHNDVPMDVFTTAADAAIKSLWDTRRIVGTPSGCRAAPAD